jgi:hypothetical protein
MTENGELCFFPLDYNLFEAGQTLTFVKKTGYSRITPVSKDKGERQKFILWQTSDTRNAPEFIYPDYKTDNLNINFYTGRFPIRSINSKNKKILVLDYAGNISVYDAQRPSAAAGFTLSSIGAIDAAIIDEKYFIICRGAVGEDSPFLVVNYNTGETVPVPLDAAAGITAYAGNTNIYAAAVERSGGNKTVIYSLPAFGTSAANSIFEYPGETVNLSITESDGIPAIAADSEGAKIYADSVVNFKRTEGLPVKLIGLDNFFLSLDSEGNIAWHDNKTGELSAVLKIYKDSWELTSGKKITGGITKE